MSMHNVEKFRYGFRKGRHFAQVIINLNNNLLCLKSRDKEIAVNFVDFRKAYDNNDRSILIKILLDLGRE